MTTKLAAFQPGEFIVTRDIEKRANANPVVTVTVSRVTETVHEFVIAKALKAYCYVDGYPELGRELPAPRELIAHIDTDCRALFDF